MSRRVGCGEWLVAVGEDVATDADDHDRELLDAYDEASGHEVGTDPEDADDAEPSENDETAPWRGF